jgi:hypothetical protein
MIKRKMNNFSVTITISKTFTLAAYDKEAAVSKAISYGIDRTLKDAEFSTSVKKVNSYD